MLVLATAESELSCLVWFESRVGALSIMTSGANDFYYSGKYEDDEYEYRHVHVTKEIAKLIPKNRLLTESEWRNLGIQQSPGWVHYMIHSPERHILLFRRKLEKPKNTAAATQKSSKSVGVRG
ncbi:unnamed protein product [Enterobius vermicularis]|uniref:Cyclin-dependent kinases regulatory subunit n=1 Tax=Enterobius vermicularis TaxID=51028 RepID=A0A0N4VCF4_ENTVE|nr:unnamed protein product [Enterobius vermicularis]